MVSDGTYFYLDCQNDFVRGIYPESDFRGTDDAIQTAANYEAVLYKIEYQAGEMASCMVVYDPKGGL